MTAAITNHPYADLMTRFLIGSQLVYDSFALELMVYLNHYSADAETDAVFTYNLDGKTETVTLDRHWGTRLKFGREQFENADFWPQEFIQCIVQADQLVITKIVFLDKTHHQNT